MATNFTSDEIMTVSETAKWLRCGRRNIYRMAREGKLPAIRIGKFILFRRATIKAWLDEREGNE